MILSEIIDLLLELNRETGMAILFIVHDLQAVAYMCDRVYVMKDGEIVDESVKVDGEFEFSYLYSRRLFGAVLGSVLKCTIDD